MKNIVVYKIIWIFVYVIIGGMIGVLLNEFSTAKTPPSTTFKNPIVLEDPIMGKGIFQEMGGNIEDTIKYREHIEQVAYSIDDLGNGKSLVTLNIPAITRESSTNQRKIFDTIRALSHYDLTLNISGQDKIDLSTLGTLLGEISSFEDLQMVYFDFPPNYYEIFEKIQWMMNPIGKNITLTIHGPSFPYGFSLDALLLDTKKMIQKNNGDIPVASFVLDIEESRGIYFLLSDDMIIRDFPTRSFRADHLMINTLPPPPGDGIRGKALVEKLLHDSPMKYIEINGVGKKEDGKITLEGY